VSEETTNGNGKGIGIQGLMVLVKRDDGHVSQIPLTTEQQEKLFNFITHKLYGGIVKLSSDKS
jgi:hypothetical protein